MVEARTGQREFTYRIAVTKLKGDPTAWSSDPTIAANLPGCDIGFVTFEEMWADVITPAKDGSTKPAPSEVGRLAQLLRASGVLTKDDS